MSREGATKKAKAPKERALFESSVPAWLRVQASLAEKTDVTLATMASDGLKFDRIENDNSICAAMVASPEHAPLCELDCGRAYGRTTTAGKGIEYRCHAGLHCFSTPVTLDGRKLVVLGGRVFTSISEYANLLRRYSDLDPIADGHALTNVKFVDRRDLQDIRGLVATTALNHSEAAREGFGGPLDAPRHLLDAHLEIIRLTDELTSKNRSIEQLSAFLSDAASAVEPKRDFAYVLARVSEVMKSDRASLMVLDEESSDLAMVAATGFDVIPARVKLGDPIAGAVLASGSPMMVRDVDADDRVPGARRNLYKTKSFISYPITLGSKKLGVINLTGRTDGAPYAQEDLALVELMAPQLALMIDRGEWHKKAEEFQQMSLTDPLTALPNRRYLEERLYEEVERCKRHGTPLSFLIIDVDDFKNYNDLYGHTNADHVLIRTAQALRKCVRTIDMSARFAGDEFCIILPETEMDAAFRIAERLRSEVNSIQYHSDAGRAVGRITISIGISSFSRNRQSPKAIMETADRALYQAKTRGRNCVVVYDEDRLDQANLVIPHQGITFSRVERE